MKVLTPDRAEVVAQERATIIVPKEIPGLGGTVQEIMRRWRPESLLGQAVRDALPYVPEELAFELVERSVSAGIIESRLAMRHFGLDGKLIEDYGIVRRKVVTTAGVGFIVDAFQNGVELEIMRYHGIGTDNTAENASDTDLVTELTTEYTSDNTRATGSQTENGANVFRSVGTNQVDASVGIVEHGLLSNATVGSGVLLDRSVFGTISLTSGESLESTYDITFTAGS
jgi:hypothetical protein